MPVKTIITNLKFLFKLQVFKSHRRVFINEIDFKTEKAKTIYHRKTKKFSFKELGRECKPI